RGLWPAAGAGRGHRAGRHRAVPAGDGSTDRDRQGTAAVTLPASADAFFAVGLIVAGVGAIFFFADRDNPGGRALALSLLAMGLQLLLAPLESTAGWALVATGQLLETFSILTGLEWGRRVGQRSSKG